MQQLPISIRKLVAIWIHRCFIMFMNPMWQAMPTYQTMFRMGSMHGTVEQNRLTSGLRYFKLSWKYRVFIHPRWLFGISAINKTSFTSISLTFTSWFFPAKKKNLWFLDMTCSSRLAGVPSVGFWGLTVGFYINAFNGIGLMSLSP